ncbi:hypothetical protein A6R74_17525 [Halomonas sp. ALS9]|nr:hypothetical protein A6R74_17525 [Halomonas sp. ALS9]
MRTREELIDHINHGNTVKYVFFWGHQKPKSGVSASCFSQWYESPFVKGNQTYLTAEHYMMAKKAELFGDEIARRKALSSKTPGEAKKMGRSVVGFNKDIWVEIRFEIVVSANLAKFSQNPELKAFLLNTGDRVLVEASPVDKIWGIGLAADDPATSDPYKWQGLNLLGFALMCVRDQLKC